MSDLSSTSSSEMLCEIARRLETADPAEVRGTDLSRNQLAEAVAKGRRDVIRVLAEIAGKDRTWKGRSGWLYGHRGDACVCPSQADAISQVCEKNYGLTISPAEIAEALGDESEVGR